MRREVEPYGSVAQLSRGGQMVKAPDSDSGDFEGSTPSRGTSYNRGGELERLVRIHSSAVPPHGNAPADRPAVEEVRPKFAIFT